MNKVIKTLTLITIVLYVPTLIASFYGMNVPLPGSTSPNSFLMIIGVSLTVCLGILMIFMRRRWF